MSRSVLPRHADTHLDGQLNPSLHPDCELCAPLLRHMPKKPSVAPRRWVADQPLPKWTSRYIYSSRRTATAEPQWRSRRWWRRRGRQAAPSQRRASGVPRRAAAACAPPRATSSSGPTSAAAARRQGSRTEQRQWCSPGSPLSHDASRSCGMRRRTAQIQVHPALSAPNPPPRTLPAPDGGAAGSKAGGARCTSKPARLLRGLLVWRL